MHNGNWGHCKTCKHFGSPAARPLGAEEASCQEPTLVKFQLRVYGSNGCNHWELRAGIPADSDRGAHAQASGSPGVEEGTLQ